MPDLTPTTQPSIAIATSQARLTIGTRGSALALWQANAVRDLLAQEAPDIAIDLHVIRPEGDLDKQSSLLQIGGRGVFASALQQALLDRTVDLAVHSTKDVPTIEPSGLVIAAFPQREDARDVVISRHGVGLADLPQSPVIGTSSRRRAVQVLALRPDATITDLRGNIDTRLRKAESADYDAVILAAAGLTRMGWQERITEYLPFDRFVPSPGQGALAIETRIEPDTAFAIAAALDDPAISLAVSLERTFLQAMGGGCTTPIGAHAEVNGEQVRFWGMIASDDGARVLHVDERLPLDTAADGVSRLADRMLKDLGARWQGVERSSPDRDRPLAGRTAIVTGTAGFTRRLAKAFASEGASFLPAPTLDVQPPSDQLRLATALDALANGDYDCLVVTSRQSIPALTGRAIPPATRVAAVGNGTARALEREGVRVDLVPEEQTSAGLATAFDDIELAGARVLCLLGDRAGETVTSALEARGAQVDRVESYRTTPVTALPDDVHAAAHAGRVDIVVMASPASARTLVSLLGVDLAALSGACLVALGPTTAAAMRDLGLPVHLVSPDPSPDGVAAAVRDYFATRF